MKENENIQEFWEKKEKEKNSKLVIATACEYIRGIKDIEGPIYGLLYLMENAFYFENFDDQNFMKNIFFKKEEFRKINFNIVLSEIKDVKTYNGHRNKSDLKFLNKVLNFFGFITDILVIKIKNNEEYLFKCIESPLNISEKYYQIIK